MNRNRHATPLCTSALAALGLGLGGCLDYTFETTVEPDGTGVRVERIEVTRRGDVELPEAELRTLTLTTADRGWAHSLEVDENGDTTWILERRTVVEDLAAWSDPRGDTILLGAAPAKANTRLGYLRLGDVVFRSSTQVGVARRSDGTSVISYREAFVWDHAADALVEFLMRDLDRRLAERYPRLSDAERASIVGYARARVWVAADEGLFLGEDEDEAIARAVESTAAHGVKIVRMRQPDADPRFLRDTMTELLDLDDEEATRLFEEILPGLNLAFNSTVTFRLRLPGRVTETNADRRDGRTLEWEFSPLDHLAGPLELFAESVFDGGSGRPSPR